MPTRNQDRAPAGSCLLLAEDEPTIATTLTDDLHDRGYRVIRTADGAEAVRMLREHSFAAVITDLRLPGADGIAVADAARQRLGAVPILVVSAHFASYAKALAPLAVDCLAKPFLNEAVLDWLAGNRIPA